MKVKRLIDGIIFKVVALDVSMRGTKELARLLPEDVNVTSAGETLIKVKRISDKRVFDVEAIDTRLDGADQGARFSPDQVEIVPDSTITGKFNV